MKREVKNLNTEVGSRHRTPAVSPALPIPREHLIRPAATVSSSDVEREKSLSEEGFITKEVVAERLSVTPETVRRWASAGKLPSHHFGRRLRFKWSEVSAALANGLRAGVATIGGGR